MILSEEEKARNREAFRAMGLAEKADYIFSYYKLPLVIALIVVVALGSVVHRMVTHKDTVLYVAFANVVLPPDAELALTEGYVDETDRDKRSDVSPATVSSTSPRTRVSRTTSTPMRLASSSWPRPRTSSSTSSS